MSNNGNLRGRVREQRERAEQAPGTDVEKREAPPQTIAQFIEVMKGEMARALPRHLNADRLARIALTEVRRTPLLARCTQQSLGGALMTCAQLGLEPGVTGEAYLLPFRNTSQNVHEVQLIIGYQGMAKLFWQSPLARSLDAQAVYERDDFEYEYGLNPSLIHRPSLADDRGRAIAYYAVATMTNGGSAFVVMSRGDVEKIRARSRAKDNGPWKTDYDAMAKKTCVRQLFKLLPKSAELAQAIAQDEAVRTDMSADAIDIIPEYPDAVPGDVVRAEPEVDIPPGGEIPPPADGVTVEDPPEDLFAEPGEPE